MAGFFHFGSRPRQSAALRRDFPICCRRCSAGLTKRDRVNLSDGGHIENFGVYELLRRRCKYIVAIDGEQDPKMTFGGLTTLQRLAAIDLGVTIDIGVGQLRLGEKGLHDRAT
ncbi:hypothetical protein LQG66_20720 [Bradyrhizobium ontarionense]|uniref:Uncharacterized protein n=1 Tax=Bradyrhizobium ontarionense TaxID=2898149 RepID=A0ABY3R378_9BRAD|nr:hypothetical protein [Bradyrhizobium sp. A19]UFZ01741.1 hypothetical protein LQG66_20720 [Bradyrhizobium sp. A19]